MEIVEKIKFKQSSSVLTLIAQEDFMYRNYPYRLYGINGICLGDSTKGQPFQFQTTGVFTLSINDSLLEGKENFGVGKMLYFHDGKLKFYVVNTGVEYVEDNSAVVFGVVVSDIHAISKRFDFVVVQEGVSL